LPNGAFVLLVFYDKALLFFYGGKKEFLACNILAMRKSDWNRFRPDFAGGTTSYDKTMEKHLDIDERIETRESK
jgi:hypothetical protein